MRPGERDAGPRPASPPGRTLLERAGPLARITLDNAGVRNALTLAMYDQLEAACASLAIDPGTRLVVIRGAHGSFAAGTDVRDLVAVDSGAAGVLYEHRITEVLDAVRALPVPVAAVVEGPAVGGGLAIVACCDVVYATPDAVFGAPVARTLGNCVSPATTARMRAGMGRALATDLLLTGRLAGAGELHAAGMVTAVVPAHELDAAVAGLLARVSSCAPGSVAAAKEFGRRLDDRAADVDADDVYRRVYGSSDFRDGVDAFLAHRPPPWAS